MQLSCKKVLKFAVLDNSFLDLFTETQIRYREIFKFSQGRYFSKIK